MSEVEVKIRATKAYKDIVLGRRVLGGERLTVTKSRASDLVKVGVAEILEIPKEEVKLSSKKDVKKTVKKAKRAAKK